MNYLFVSSCHILITISIQSSVPKILQCGNCLAKQTLEKCNSVPGYVMGEIIFHSFYDYDYYFAQIIQIIISKRRAEIIWSWILLTLSLLLHQIFTLAKIFLPHMLLIKLRFPLCSLSKVKLFLALGICVFSDSYIVLHPRTDYVLISCSRLPAASNI